MSLELYSGDASVLKYLGNTGQALQVLVGIFQLESDGVHLNSKGHKLRHLLFGKGMIPRVDVLELCGQRIGKLSELFDLVTEFGLEKRVGHS